ncbi:50S ribosomal protein L23 [Candidatus Dojkabacteria bacterium]|nr:50S ribosomal protein L23 [Candidatus Dojkabacteria bacterium]
MNKVEASKIIIRPVVTEKTLDLVEKENQYTFVIGKRFNKIEVQKAVALLFNVKVLGVRILNVLGKKTRFGKSRIEGKRQGMKKAIVTLKVGDKISAFEIK